ncbi:uncharacterized protein LOC129265102 isoform X1 [Lytechinus pictus]|uniref:uncharacterized protein LOC129265102 isoform X1 n=1 Tax=Lytechinus pictus TaxID=7653 RepID=UPI0030BA254A
MYFKMADYGSGKQHGQDKGFECPACKMKFSFRTNLNRHKRTIHKKETKRERTSCTIPGCTAKFYHQTKLLSHLEVVHGKHIDKTELTFSSMDKFFMWKMQEEAQNFVCFTKQRGCVTHSSVTHQHYICQRDGSSRSHTSKNQPGRKTRRKLQKGVIKTDLVCPARMLLRQCKKTGRVDVSYYKSHSHAISPSDLVHHPLPESVRKDIRSKLESGSTVNQIYQEFQNPSPGLQSSSTIYDHRLKLINKSQIRAIQRQLQKSKPVQPPSDTAYNVVVEVLQMADTCNTKVRRENHDEQTSLQQTTPLDINTERGNIAQEVLLSQPMANPLGETTIPPDYVSRLQGLLSDILVLMENENIRKSMLPYVMGNLEGMLSLCHQEANSLNVRHVEEVISVQKPS